METLLYRRYCPDPEARRPGRRTTSYTLVDGEVRRRKPASRMDYLKHRSWGNDTVDKLLAWMTDNQATGDEGAKHFLKTTENVWTKWVPADVAAKVKAGL